ncbi:MAG TPA: hypothetical protein VGQ69_11320, partial [Gemmatimonadales bacterium]|nr:hypothetical protein [Gemmatimonadales bacterium]
MKLKFLVSAALLGGLVSFAWGSIAHGTGMFSSLEPKAFTDSTAVLQTIKANAPENGIYFEGHGIFAAVSFRPDLAQKFESLVVPMLYQLGVEIAVALILAWVLLRLPVWPALGTGSLFATVGVAAGIEQLLPEANWYGFPIATQLA